MFDTTALIPAYTYVKNRIVIPATIPLKDAYNYITEQLQEQYKEDFLGFYGVWDTASVAQKHNATTIPYASGKIDFYLHIYVFRDSRSRPLYAKAKFSYAFADQLPAPKHEAHYRSNERAVGSRMQKEIRVVDAPVFLQTSLLAGIALGKVYSKDVFEGRQFPMVLPASDSVFAVSEAAQMLEVIRKLKVTDGISLNPFVIIHTVQSHSMEAFNRAFLLAKLVGGMRKLNHWTTRMHRSQTKRFNDVYKKMYPQEFQAFYAKNQERVTVMTTLSGAYLPIDSVVGVTADSEDALALLLFNPFASIHVEVVGNEITTHVVHKLGNHSLEDSISALEKPVFKELLAPLITA